MTRIITQYERLYNDKRVQITRHILTDNRVGKKFRQIIEESDLTQAQVAHKMGISRHKLSDLINGRVNLSQERRDKIIKITQHQPKDATQLKLF